MTRPVSLRKASLLACVSVLSSVGLLQAWLAQTASAPRELTDQEVIDRFHQLFYENPETWAANRWLGVLTQQNPNDVWIIQEILAEVRPDFVVETGTALGGSAILWASILQHVNAQGRVITIDIEDWTGMDSDEWVRKAGSLGIEIDDATRRLARSHPLFKERVDFLLGSSTAPEIVEEVSRRVAGKKVVVILDSDHSRSHVRRELRLYAPLVPVGSYIVVQDTNVNGHPVHQQHGPGPWEAIEGFLAQNDAFVVDRSRERLLFTMHPGGFLKRVR